MSCQVADGHLGWKQRVERETRRQNSYYNRAYHLEPEQAYQEP